MDSNQATRKPISDSCARIEELAFTHGQAYDSYLSTEPGLTPFWSRSGHGVIVYAKVGRYLHVQGGLLGPVAERPQLLQEFVRFLQQHRFVATFYNAGVDDIPLFRAEGFQVTKWGEEPLLDLDQLNWSGHQYEWVRRQVNSCRRHGVVVTECLRHHCSDQEWNETLNEIRSITDQCLSTKPQRGSVPFFNGRVDPDPWHRRRIFVARSEKGTGRIEGFLICLPFDGGRQWSIETYRHRLDAPKGVVAWMIHQAIDIMQVDGVKAVSLCLCPAIRYERLPQDSWIFRRCLQFGFHYASAFFDMPGEYHFKSRFRPRFIRRFICHWPRASAASMWSTVRLSQALDLDLKRFVRNLWLRSFRPQKRRNLAVPAEQPQQPREAATKQSQPTKKTKSTH